MSGLTASKRDTTWAVASATLPAYRMKLKCRAVRMPGPDIVADGIHRNFTPI